MAFTQPTMSLSKVAMGSFEKLISEIFRSICAMSPEQDAAKSNTDSIFLMIANYKDFKPTEKLRSFTFKRDYEMD